MTSEEQLRVAFERLAQAAKECLDTYERVCRREPAEGETEPAADHHARLAAGTEEG
jgi:hypothetical protein